MTVTAQLSISLDGFLAGPRPSLDDPLGQGGMQLHEWAFRLAAWRGPHGLEGGETGPDSALVERDLAANGSFVMGRKMFSGGAGAWEDDPNATGWWGDEPPYHAPVFVVTHHARERLDLQGGTSFTFVTDGVASAVEQARAAADGKNVSIAGGADVVQQCRALGLLDELTVHVAPLFLGGGTRLFEHVPPGRLEILEVVDVPSATHVRYAVTR
jgi:dihydrofolate reductase